MFWLLGSHQEFTDRHHLPISLWALGSQASLSATCSQDPSRTCGDLLTLPLQPILDTTYIWWKVNEIRQESLLTAQRGSEGSGLSPGPGHSQGEDATLSWGCHFVYSHQILAPRIKAPGGMALYDVYNTFQVPTRIPSGCAIHFRIQALLPNDFLVTWLLVECLS